MFYKRKDVNLLTSLAEERIPKDLLERFVEEIFIASGLDERQSKSISKHLVLANARGVDSHGVSRVEIYTKRLDLGLVNKTFEPVITRESPVSALIDAQNGSGIPVAKHGMEIAINKAKESGVGIVGIHNSNHCGMLADYVNDAVNHDCIAIATTNAPSNMPPWGGKDRFFGTNPFAFGVPAGNENNILFDMATSTVARGKIILAQKNNQEIPLGWALSPEGVPTTNPDEALKGVVLPVGGHKGYGIAFLVEVLSSLFTGAAFGPFIGDLYNELDHTQNVGHFFLVMRADLFQGIEEFKMRIDQMIHEIREIPLMEGIENIYLPGEIEMETRQDREEKGIPLSKEIRNELIKVAKRNHVNERLLTEIPK
ncbi:Ldh family oxidoreductase [Pseudalkalibacillus sp. A8]|uniref:Ldh family oxidoreductase n=1 Tax=Pseudalkalibacillus sp. A8 TaxID=3382641 RepID=UPI0038B604D2